MVQPSVCEPARKPWAWTALIILLVVMPFDAHGQAAGQSIDELTAEAESAYEAGELQRSVMLWTYLSALHDRRSEAALHNGARALARAGETDAALSLYGTAAVRRDAAGDLYRRVVQLHATSPALRPRRGPNDEVIFVESVRALLTRELSVPESVVEHVNSAESATKALETLTLNRDAKMTFVSHTEGIQVEFRRWFYDGVEGALWERVATDTTLVVAAAAYRVRYVVDNATRDTVMVTVPCADGCVLKLPVQ